MIKKILSVIFIVIGIAAAVTAVLASKKLDTPKPIAAAATDEVRPTTLE